MKVFAVFLTLMMTSCSTKHRHPPPLPYDDKVGPLRLVYHPSKPAIQDRIELIEAAYVALQGYRALGLVVPFPVTVNVHQARSVPCGNPNAGGCYTYQNQQIRVWTGSHNDLPWLIHELYHAYLHANPGIAPPSRWPADPAHLQSRWPCVDNSARYWSQQLRTKRGGPFTYPDPLRVRC